MALSITADVARKYASGIENKYDDVVVVFSTQVWSGQVLATSVVEFGGKARPFDNAVTFTLPIFVGFAVQSLLQGAATTNRVKVRRAGRVIIPTITGATTQADVDTGLPVYASNDGTFTMTDTSNLLIGEITNFVAGEGFHVEFKATVVRA